MYSARALRAVPSGASLFSVSVLSCHSNPCSYGACEEITGGFKCTCQPGYNGTQCDQGEIITQVQHRGSLDSCLKWKSLVTEATQPCKSRSNLWPTTPRKR